MENLSNFDLGPLTWVKAEIDNAFHSASTALESWNGHDTVPLREAATYLHQVSGALQIVDLQGVYQVVNATEGLLADMQVKADLCNQDSSRIVLTSIKALRSYLDGLMAGGPNNELLLNPVYSEIQTRRGGEAPSPSDLFRPDLGARAKRPSPESPMDDRALARAIHSVRSRYQKGLLQILQNRDRQSGLQSIGQAVREIESLAPGAAQYTFWWAAGGLVEALLDGRLEPDIWVKRALGRLDLQMRRLSEGSKQLADRLFRDVLFFLSQDSAITGRAAEARELFELERYQVLKSSGLNETEVDVLQPRVNALRDAINATKDQWLRLCAGRQDSLEPLKSAAKQVLDCVNELPPGPLSELAGSVRDAANATVSSKEAAQNEALQLEMATALLLLQHGAESYFNLGHDFADLAGVQARRLQAAQAGEYELSGKSSMPLLDQIARQAQEKLLMAQVTREIQTNLHQVEEILDRFFRNQSERANLPMVPGLLKQIQGALNMLQLDVAAELVQATLGHVEHVSGADAKLGAEELNWIADAISTLGLYVDALRNGRDDPIGLRVLLAPPAEAVPVEVSVEQELEESAARLKETADQLAEATDQVEARGEIKRELSRIAQDADLVGDSDLRGQAGEALRLIDEGASTEAIQAAVQTLAGAPAAPASAEPVPAPVASEQEVDAELLQIYIEEAKEVLADTDSNLVRLHASALDNEAFVNIRRGFHTLKGSGRMVGLTDLAEVAWEAEQTLNLWLRDERPINRPVLDFIEMAAKAFHGWVSELEVRGGVELLHAGQVVAEARQLRGEAVEPAVIQPASGLEPIPEPVPEPVPEEPETIAIGQHLVPAPLFAIFAEESSHRLDDLRNQLASMAESTGDTPWEDFSRAAHTLAGIARTTGLTPLADAAHAVENWANGWPATARPLAEAAYGVVSGVLTELAAQLNEILEQRWPEALPDLEARLAALRVEVESVPEMTPSPAPESVEAVQEAVSPVAVPEPVVETETQPIAEEPVAVPVAIDECDPQLLPIFLAEADELLPRIGESLRHWRAQPADQEICQSLQRSLHTLKGSARMAGAMSMGDEAHEMEERIVERGETAPDDAFLDQLEHQYDVLAEQVDRLRPTAGPAAASRREAFAVPMPAAVALPAEDEASAQQVFRAQASIVDNLINEAGE
ncbi:MAG: Hpt domain-containing protein, partial [Parasulfuritortus sp.]|nr:Hpt domain-containing protein [Parasulfuritortus sp.]